MTQRLAVIPAANSRKHNDGTDVKSSGNDRTSAQRQLILHNAKALFWKNGYENTSLRMLARDCEFEVSNLYNYFESKEDILFQILFNDMTSLVDSLCDLGNGDAPRPFEDLRSLVDFHLQRIGSVGQPGLLHEITLRNLSTPHRRKIVQLRDHYDDYLRNIINKGIETNDFRRLDTNLVSILIISMLTRSALWFSPKGRLPMNEVANIMYDFVLNGLRNKA